MCSSSASSVRRAALEARGDWPKSIELILHFPDQFLHIFHRLVQVQGAGLIVRELHSGRRRLTAGSLATLERRTSHGLIVAEHGPERLLLAQTALLVLVRQNTMMMLMMMMMAVAVVVVVGVILIRAERTASLIAWTGAVSILLLLLLLVVVVAVLILEIALVEAEAERRARA